MTEFYKNVKLIYNSIIVTSVALIIIVLPTSVNSNKYDLAVKEIQNIRETKEEIKNIEDNKISKHYGNSLNFIEDILQLPFQNLTIKYEDNVSNPKLNDENYGISSFLFWSTINLKKFEIGPNFKSRVDLTALKKWHSKNRSEGKLSEVTGWSFSGSAGFNTNITLLKDRLFIHPIIDFELKDGGYIPIFDDTNSSNIEYIFDVLEKNNLLRGKKNEYITSNYKINTCPQLNNPEIWIDIQDSTLDEAELYLIDKSENLKKLQTKPLSILGFSIPTSYTAIVGPIVLISLLFFLCLHIKQLKIELTKAEEKKRYPWIGIFDDKISKLVFRLLVQLLPIVACFMVLFSSDFNICIDVTLIFIFTFLILFIGNEIVKNSEYIVQILNQTKS